MTKKERKCPVETAAKFCSLIRSTNCVGAKKKGVDGNMWEIIKIKNGVKRWKKTAKKVKKVKKVKQTKKVKKVKKVKQTKKVTKKVKKVKQTKTAKKVKKVKKVKKTKDTVLDLKKIVKKSTIQDILSREKGLTKKERDLLNKTLSQSELCFLTNFRYAPDPQRYDKMSKNQLISEFKYPRWD